MISIRHAISLADREIVCNVMNNFENVDNSYTYGFYNENNICVGGASVSDKDNSSFTLVIDTKPTYNVGKLMAELFKIILPIFNQITAKIYKTNFKSIKMARQMGFRKIINESDYYVYIFSKELWRYNDKWAL